MVRALGLKAGDEIEVSIAGARTIKIAKTPSATERLRRLRRFRGRMPEGYRFSRADASER